MSYHIFNLKQLDEIDDFNEKLDLDELYQEKIKSERMKLDVYNRMLARVHKKIKLTSRQKVDDQFCCFIVPEMMIGVPKYNQEACINYIMEKLHINNFIIKYIHPNCLFISWKHWIPNYVRDQFKKKTGITIDGNGCVIDKNKNNPVMKMLGYENDTKHSISPTETRFKNTDDYKESGKLIYTDALLGKLQRIVDTTRENKKK